MSVPDPLSAEDLAAGCTICGGTGKVGIWRCDHTPLREVPASEPLSAEDLAGYRAMLEAATPGPWKLSEPQGNWIWPHVCNTYGSRHEDAVLIAAAPGVIGKLLDEVERLRAEINAALGGDCIEETSYGDPRPRYYYRTRRSQQQMSENQQCGP